MSAIITQVLTRSWRPLLYVLLGAVVAGSVAWKVRAWQAESLIASAHVAQARAERDLSDLRATIASNVAELERLRADEQMKALNATRVQTAKLLDLQARLAESERARVQVSAKLNEELAHASADDARDLGPVVLRYLERVRAEQSAP